MSRWPLGVLAGLGILLIGAGLYLALRPTRPTAADLAAYGQQIREPWAAYMSGVAVLHDRIDQPFGVAAIASLMQPAADRLHAIAPPRSLDATHERVRAMLATCDPVVRAAKQNHINRADLDACQAAIDALNHEFASLQ